MKEKDGTNVSEQDVSREFHRNSLKKTDLISCGSNTVPVRLFEIGTCLSTDCNFAGPAGFPCNCGQGYFKSIVVGTPEDINRFPNKFLDSDSESESESESEDESEDETPRKRKRSSTSKAPSLEDLQAIEKLKKNSVSVLKDMYEEKFGQTARGRFASNVNWLAKQITLFKNQ